VVEIASGVEVALGVEVASGVELASGVEVASGVGVASGLDVAAGVGDASEVDEDEMGEARADGLGGVAEVGGFDAAGMGTLKLKPQFAAIPRPEAVAPLSCCWRIARS